MQLVKVISTELDNVKRRLVKVLRFGKSDVQTPFEAMPHGIDSNPVEDMVAVYGETTTKGKPVVIGYLNKEQLAEVGGTRIYSTDDEGSVKFAIYLRADGTCEVGGDTDNMVRYSKLKSEYDKTKEVLDIILQILTGSPINEPGNGSPSALQSALSLALQGKATGDISSSKIDEIKTL